MFSIVVPTFRRFDQLQQCLRCLAPGAQTLAATEYEVIVTDDEGESSGTRQQLGEFPWVRWVAGPGKGPAANRNNGARHANGEWLVFTDDDCLPSSGWLAAYKAATVGYPHLSVLEGRTHADRPKRSLAETAPINETGGFLWSCNFAIRAALFDELKGFDERFIYAAMEDVELRVRLEEKREPILFVPQAAVCHPWRDNGGLKAFRRHAKASSLFYQLHPRMKGQQQFFDLLKSSFKYFALEAVPGLFRYRGRGFCRYVLLSIVHLAVSRQVHRDS